MKVSSITTILGLSAPLVSAAGGLKGTMISRDLQQAAQWNSDATPTLEDMENLYNGFCTLCAIGEMFNSDSQFCFLCDINTTPPETSGGIDCFSEVSTVQVENIGSVAMKDLKIGARILTGSGSFEPVYAFGHRNPTKSADFLQFKTDGNSQLEMTGGHLVFVEGQTNPVRADSIKMGDVLSPGATVIKIKTIQRDGVYVPLTPGGTVVVDGIVASSYISLQKDAATVELQGGISTFLSYQDLIHMALSPFRMFCMGISSTLGNTYNADGLPLYAAYGMDLIHWANSQNIVIQSLVLLVILVLTGACMFLENTFGASMAPLALFAGAGAYAVLKKNNIAFRANKVKSA